MLAHLAIFAAGRGNNGRIWLALVAFLAAPVALGQENGEAATLEPFETEATQVYESARLAVVGVQTGQANAMAQSGFGAGFVIDRKRRWIVTSSDVVSARTKEVSVRFADHTVSAAKVLVRDADRAAVLLESASLPDGVREIGFARAGSSRVGTMIFTLGSPYQSIQRDLAVAASLGVVSGRYALAGRNRPKGELLEVSAAVNPGSFGGPVIDLSGRVVGMAVSPYSNSRWLGTAVPAEALDPWVTDLVANAGPAPAKGGYLGVVPVPTDHGLAIERLVEGSPAAGSELAVGDILIEGGASPLASLEDWRRLLANKKPGDTLSLKVRRSGDSELTVEIVLGSRFM